MRERCVMSVVGPSCVGKSQLAKAVVEVLGPEVAARVPTDYFFVPRETNVPMAAFDREALRYDWALVRQLLDEPIGTATSTPDVDFERFTRRGDTGGIPITVRPVMILDAMAPFPDADLWVRVEVPDAVRRKRLAARDTRWGTDVASRWKHLEATWADAMSLLEGREPDVVLDGEHPLVENAQRLADVIRTWLTEG